VYAIIATTACLGVQVLLKPVFGPMQFFLLFPLTFIVASLGGMGPALVVIILGGVGANRLLPDPLSALNMPNHSLISLAKFGIFAFTTLAGSWLIHLLQDKKQKLENDIDILRASDKQFKLLADSSPVMIWMTNADRVPTWFNKNWQDFTGLDLDQSINGKVSDWIYPDDYDSVIQSFGESFDTQKDFKKEYRIKNSDGEFRWLLCNAVPMYNNDEFCGYIGVCVDINDHKVSEEKIRKALQSRDQFLSVASHELKTPISSLTLQAQVFKKMLEKQESEAIPKEKIIKVSEQITRQVFRLDRLIDDMLDNSRINSGRFHIHPEEFNIAELIEDTTERIKSQFSNFRETGLIITFDFDKENPNSFDGMWDKIKIEQLITNLLTNAIKYGDKKPIEVSIVSKEDSIKIIVKDHGIGISKDNLDKVFNRFYRIAGTSSESGLGLGLFISKQIVKAHKGQIWVESELGKGSSFIIELPRLTYEASEDYNA